MTEKGWGERWWQVLKNIKDAHAHEFDYYNIAG